GCRKAGRGCPGSRHWPTSGSARRPSSSSGVGIDPDCPRTDHRGHWGPQGSRGGTRSTSQRNRRYRPRVRRRVLGRSEAVMGSGPVKPRSSRLGAVVIVVVVAAVGGPAVWRAIRGDLPWGAEKAAQIERLKATVLPVIEDLQVEHYMDVHGCANLTYPRGDFIDGDPE